MAASPGFIAKEESTPITHSRVRLWRMCFSVEQTKVKTLKRSATEPQPKPLTAEDAGGAGKSAGRGLFFRVKIVAGCEDFSGLALQRKRRKQRFFGVVTLVQSFSSPARLLLSSRQYTQKNSAPSASSAFQDFGFDFVLVAAPSRCV